MQPKDHTQSLAIRTAGLARRFGTLIAVDHIYLQVPQRSVYGFLGPNGAGKTTTIRMLLGLIRPHVGEVHLFGMPLRKNRLSLMRRVGALVESPSLYPHLTGRENLEVTRRLIGGDQKLISEVLETVHMETAADHQVRSYSSGMRQRLALALALIGKPELLILDEPTNGLDPSGIREMRELLRRFPAEYGTTVFLSSHLLSEVEQVATHIGILREGKLIFQGTSQELKAQLEDRLTIGVDRPGEAFLTLTQGGWTANRNGDNQLYVTINGRSDAALINRLLVENGINVFHLNQQQASLEDIFLKFTA
jgi:ABC-type multidrug transport system ATPase subunit